MILALDTEAYSNLQRGDPDVLRAIQVAAEVILPLITLGELRAGFLDGNQTEKNERRLETFLRERRVRIVGPDEQTTFVYGRLFAQLQKHGRRIPANDLWIAALVMQHGWTLCSRDAHFDHLPQIPRWQ